ncbi:carboxymuconolactone decarboxylase family protein [Mycobacterium asiaticum]|uniref:Alkylhydroperoxidase AhpD family core domain-containing protein n=1 Tax=Mycobacterium asiaticum TaxID=1790 RepID=A0A1A3BGT8_MYCAS|nr:carboxymuconolactone decarboxylase family protein [Mycobacterium asiaticum]OBI74249.1 alkylhydroperoxidase AhpD family core domain-containing protein [Mycobacterium asiaticum]
MRLQVLDGGHPPHIKALFGVIRLVSRHPVVDAVKLAFYRRDFYGGGELTHEAMRGASEWSVGDRELMAAVVSQANDCPFCVAAHTATSRQWYQNDAKVAATLEDLDAAPIGAPLRETLRLLGKLAREHRVDAGDIRTVLDAGVSAEQIEDALAVCLAFDITNRLANAFDFAIAEPAAMDAGARHLLKRGYR